MYIYIEREIQVRVAISSRGFACLTEEKPAMPAISYPRESTSTRKHKTRKHLNKLFRKPIIIYTEGFTNYPFEGDWLHMGMEIELQRGTRRIIGSHL